MGLGEIGLVQARKNSPELAVAPPCAHDTPAFLCMCVCVASVWRPGTVLGLLLWWSVTALTNIRRAVGGGVRAAVAAASIRTASLHVQLLSTMVPVPFGPIGMGTKSIRCSSICDTICSKMSLSTCIDIIQLLGTILSLFARPRMHVSMRASMYIDVDRQYGHIIPKPCISNLRHYSETNHRQFAPDFARAVPS